MTDYSRSRGFSLVELVVTIGVIGFITSIAIVSFKKVLTGTRASIAWDKAEIFNLGLKKYSQIAHDILTADVPNDSTDEFLVLRSLQWRDPADPSPGSPFYRPNYNPVASSDSDDYRIQWNGFVFEILKPGSAGTGLKIVEDGSDITTPYTFPSGYVPE